MELLLKKSEYEFTKYNITRPNWSLSWDDIG